MALWARFLQGDQHIQHIQLIQYIQQHISIYRMSSSISTYSLPPSLNKVSYQFMYSCSTLQKFGARGAGVLQNLDGPPRSPAVLAHGGLARGGRVATMASTNRLKVLCLRSNILVEEKLHGPVKDLGLVKAARYNQNS